MNKQRRLALLLCTLGLTLGSVYWLVIRERASPEKRVTVPPTCRLRLLSEAERLAPDEAWRDTIDPCEIDHPYPPAQVENPILFQSRFARVQLQNTTGQPLVVFAHSRPATPQETEQSLATQRDQIQHLRGCSERMKEHYLGLVTGRFDRHPATACFLVEERLTGAEKKETDASDFCQSAVFGHAIPSAAEIHANDHPTVSLQPGETIEFRFSILSSLSRSRSSFKPGTYTVRAAVSYAEAPSGETKQVTSEPLTVIVAEEHIKAAEAYWAGLQK